MNLLLLIGVLSMQPTQSCKTSHYRWSVKTTTSLIKQELKPTTIAEMLAKWPVPEIYGPADKCTARQGNELSVYEVTGWIHRRKEEKPPAGDGDWHLELTLNQKDAVVNNCVVAEIPDPKYGKVFQVARDSFVAKLKKQNVKIDAHGDLSTPIQVTLVGPAFFDGEHRGAKGTKNPPRAHGRCNSVSQALWEIHPIYIIK